jgi:hypothetical protein
MNMNIRTAHLFIVSLLVYSSSNAQLQSFDVNVAGVAAYGSVRYNDPLTLGQKTGSKINYSEIRGRYFWNEQWNMAIAILKGGRKVKMYQAKLNLYTSEIHYIDNGGSELAVEAGLIKQISLFSRNDSSQVIGTFVGLSGVTKDFKEHYFQLLNEGQTQLLKFTEVTLRKGDYDAMLGRTDYSFVSTARYYIKDIYGINALKALNKTAVFSILKSTSEGEEWLGKSKNRLKNELDLTAFFDFLNSQRVSKK